MTKQVYEFASRGSMDQQSRLERCKNKYFEIDVRFAKFFMLLSINQNGIKGFDSGEDNQNQELP